MSSAFSAFVILGSLGSLLLFFLILQMNRTGNKPGQTTGHSYDGIEEYDNPLPSWWYWGFILTIVYGLGYLAYYPGLGNFPGLSGWTQVGQLEAEQALADERYGPIFAQYREVPLAQLATDTVAMKMGRRLFSNNCAVCHGSAATGSFGFPNLTDEEWIWGGDAAAIEATILHGRNAAMPAWQNVMGDQGVKAVTEQVLRLAGREVDMALADEGKVHFGMYCAVCHGADATGQVLFGAPNLTNDIWLYGHSRMRIEQVIKHGRNGMMPAFDARLGADKVHILAAYVQSLKKK
ncbi:MAG: cytochrome c oxidase cbb3-type subunit 3 [Candidatus Azotimanducaceae bacterium]|jgi:cytochrome c oxidase cbb3-type subunit 3